MLLTRHAPDDLTQNKPARNGLISLHAARSMGRLELAEGPSDLLGLRQEVEIDHLLRCRARNPGAVGQHVANRDVVLPPFRKLGNERGDGLVDMQLILLL